MGLKVANPLRMGTCKVMLTCEMATSRKTATVHSVAYCAAAGITRGAQLAHGGGGPFIAAPTAPGFPERARAASKFTKLSPSASFAQFSLHQLCGNPDRQRCVVRGAEAENCYWTHIEIDVMLRFVSDTATQVQW